MTRFSTLLRPIGIGAALAGCTYVAASLLPAEVRLPVHAVLLAGIAAVYVGFAIADGRTPFLVMQGAGVLAFGALAVAGLSVHTGFLAVGYLLHGIWDLLHHRTDVPGRQAPWYIPLCLAYDWIVGAYLLLLY
jgi:uncharacterized membrane protein